VLEPFGLANPQDVAGRLQARQIPRLVGRIQHDQQDVHDGLGHQCGYRGRPDVLDPQRLGAEHRAKASGLAAEQPRPVGVVLREGDQSVVRFQRADRDRLQLLVAALLVNAVSLRSHVAVLLPRSSR
jgi:hypothetical protein